MPNRPPIHRPPHSKPPEQARRDYDRERGSAAKRLYGYRWQKASKAFLAEHPLCWYCEASDPPRVTAAAEVDHATPHKGDSVLFWDRSKWRSACKTCHRRKTATEDGGFGRPRATQDCALHGGRFRGHQGD